MTTDWCTTETISEWMALYKWLKRYTKDPGKEQWAFRGHRDSGWKLKTQIERLRCRFGVDWEDLPNCELKLFREFRRRAHIYYPNPPKKRDHLGWLALLRHHEGATRLLDFTYSPFVATYFALEDADEDAAVWAINKVWLREEAKKVVTTHVEDGCKVYNDFIIKRKGKSFDKIFWRTEPLRFAMGFAPMQLNERLSLQQSVFLCPGDITAPFEDNLRAVENGLKENVHKIIITHDSQTEILERLRRMNVDRTTLFPGLDGFARSLNARFVEISRYPVAGLRQSLGIENSSTH